MTTAKIQGSRHQAYQKSQIAAVWAVNPELCRHNRANKLHVFEQANMPAARGSTVQQYPSDEQPCKWTPSDTLHDSQSVCCKKTSTACDTALEFDLSLRGHALARLLIELNSSW